MVYAIDFLLLASLAQVRIWRFEWSIFCVNVFYYALNLWDIFCIAKIFYGDNTFSREFFIGASGEFLRCDLCMVFYILI